MFKRGISIQGKMSHSGSSTRTFDCSHFPSSDHLRRDRLGVSGCDWEAGGREGEPAQSPRQPADRNSRGKLSSLVVRLPRNCAGRIKTYATPCASR